MELPVEILFRIALFCKYYKTLGNLLLVSKDLREYIEAYPKCKEKLKNQVCENVNKKIVNIYSSYYILPNGSKHGEYKTSLKPFTENSFIKCQRFYKDGKKEGEWKKWYSSDERLSEQGFYRNDTFEGEWKRWYIDGQLWSKSFYKNGKFDGEYKSWGRDGKLRHHSFREYGMKIRRIKIE